jgi:uncharacterized protein YbjT (DUF2867 family)
MPRGSAEERELTGERFNHRFLENMSKRSISFVVTGATGNVGGLVVERLLSCGGPLPRVFVRNADKARARWGDRVDIAVGDLGDEQALVAAFEGADAALLVTSGHELAHLDAIAGTAAKRARTKLVKLSSYDARHQNVGTGVWHARGEAAIRASGARFVFVQPSGFMSNALYWAQGIKAAGIVRSATRDGRIPFIHPRDIADVATIALTTSTYDGEAIPISGPEALTYGEMTEKIAVAIGRPLRWEPMTEDDVRTQQVAWNAPPPMVDARLSIFRAIAAGRLAEVTDGVERVLGQKPVSFDRWAEENAGAFL